MRIYASLFTLILFCMTSLSGCDLNNYDARVKVPVPAQAENLSATPLTDSINLTWSAVTDTEHYKLFRCPANLTALTAEEICGAEALQACNQDPIVTASTSTIDHSVDPAGSYCYVVEACNSEDKCSAQSQATIGYAEPDILTVVASGPEFAIEGQSVSLSAAVHASAGDITYSWSQTAGSAVTLTGANSIAPSFTAPTPAAASSPENLTFSLEISRGGQTATDTVIISIQPDNIAVSAGPDKSVANGDTISLHAIGSGSGGSSDYTWLQSQGTMVILTDENTANPSFTAPAPNLPEELVFEVSFNDGQKTASDTVIVAVQGIAVPGLPNSPLTLSPANHRSPLIVSVPGSSNAFSGPASTITIAALAAGGDGHFSWSWVLDHKTPSSSPDPDPVLTHADQAVLTVDLSAITVPTQYSFAVTVTDGQGATHTETSELIVDIISAPTLFSPLVVDAPSIIVNENLPGLVSALAYGGTPPYQYQWQQLAPLSPQVILTGADTERAGLTGPNVNADTILNFEVVVTDAAGATFTKNLNVLVHDTFAYAPQQVLQLQPMPPISVLSGASSQLAFGATGGDGNYNWQWSQVSGTSATLSGETTATLAVTMPTISAIETLVFKAVVTDGLGATAEETLNVELTPLPQNTALTLVNIASLHVNEGATAVVPAQAIGGSGHYSYQWTPISGIGPGALSNRDQSALILHAPGVTAKTLITLEVVATDTVTGATAKQTVSVVINDISASLHLTSLHDIKVTSGDLVTLHGGGARGGKPPYTYTWLQTVGTPLSLTLTNAFSSNAHFTAPMVTTTTVFSFEMTARDFIGNSATVIENVTVEPPTPPLTAKLAGAASVQSGSSMSLNALAGGGIAPYTYSYTTSGVQFKIDPNANPKFTVPTVTHDTIVTVTLSVHDISTPPLVASATHKFTVKPAAPAVTPAVHAVTPVTAEICSGPLCGAFLQGEAQCPAGHPYAMNQLSISANGPVDIIKKCASRKQCQREWWEETSDRTECTDYNPAGLPSGYDFKCSFCCKTDHCNTDLLPAEATLFEGHP